MSRFPVVHLGELMASATGSVNPADYPDETFDLYSIPAFDDRGPEVVRGREVGSSKQIVRPNDVLLSKIVPHIRRSWIVSQDHGKRLIASGEWIVFRSDRVHAPYLRHVLVSDDFHAQFMSTVAGVGGSLLRARPAHVANLRIALPSLSEQRRIADVLDCADGLRAKRREAIVHLDTLTQSIFLDMFGDPATAGETDQSTRLGDLLTFVTSGSRGWADYYAPSGMRFVRSLDVQMNVIASDSAVFVDPPSNAEARRTRVQAGDVLLTITGSQIGRVAAAPRDLEGAFVSQHVAILRLDQRQVVPEFVAYFLSMEAGGQRQIAKAHYGQTKPGLNLDQIRNLHLPLPSMADQQEFKKRLTAARSVAALQTNALATLDALFSSLQHRAFRGEL